jgi:sensor domain CHASE-containing protein
LKTWLRHIQRRVQATFEKTDSSARFWALATLILLLFIWWRSMLWYQAQLLAEQRLQTQSEVSLQGNALSEAIDRRFSLLRGLHAFVLTEYNQANFDERISSFSANLYNTTSGIRNILVAPEGVITNIYPLQGNEDLLGLDLLHDLQPELQEDVRLAIETEEIILGFPLDYAQSGWGLAARQAVFLEDGQFWGLIGIVVDMPTLLADAGLYNDSPDLEYTLKDNSGEVIFESSPSHGSTGISYSLGLPQEETWKLIGHPKVDWDSSIRMDLLPIQISGLVIVLLLSGQVYFSINRQKRLASAVQERTREIAQINRTLEQRVAARTRELTTMLEVSQNVASMSDVQPLLSLILNRLQEIAPCIAVVTCQQDGR